MGKEQPCPCGENREDHFHKDSHRKDGLAYLCKKCAKSKSAEYYRRKREKILAKNREWKEENYDRHLLKTREYNQRTKGKYMESRRLSMKKFLSVPQNRISARISTGIYSTLRRNKSGRHWENLLGYSKEELIAYLINTIPTGYSVEDWYSGKLQIDHIIPISAFNFTKPEDIDFRRCWDLKNLRLIPRNENIQKSNKFERPFQPAFAMEA